MDNQFVTLPNWKNSAYTISSIRGQPLDLADRETPGATLTVDGGRTPRTGVLCSAREVEKKLDETVLKHTGRSRAGKVKVIKQRGHRLFEQDTETACPTVPPASPSPTQNTLRFADGPPLFF
jgi:hypothetical protein